MQTGRGWGGGWPPRVFQQGNVQFAGLAGDRLTQPNVLINKARKMLNQIQKRLNLQLHGCPLVFGFNQCSPRPSPKANSFPTPSKPSTAPARQLNEQRGGLPAIARTPLRSNTNDLRRPQRNS